MIGYALFYFVRKNFSLAMPGIEAELGITKTSLGLFLTLNGLIYGLSRFVNGFLADRINGRYYMGIALALCALANCAFGFGPMIAAFLTGAVSGENFAHTLILFMGITWLINGALQGAGFPPCARLLTHWIPPNELATKMSVWNTSHSIGAGVVVILCGYIMSSGGDTRVAQFQIDATNPAAVQVRLNQDSIPVAVQKANPEAVPETVPETVPEAALNNPNNSAIPGITVRNGELIIEQPMLKNDSRYTVRLTYPRPTGDANDPKAQTKTGSKISRIVLPESAGQTLSAAIAPARFSWDLSDGGKINVPQYQVTVLRSTGLWRYCFWVPAGLAFLGAIFLLFALRDTPSTIGLPELPRTEKAAAIAADQASDKPDLLKLVFLNPLIWILSIANFFVYIVRFAVLDWGPTLLSESKHVSLEHAGWLVAMFEIAGIIGMLAAGWATDRLLGGRAHRTCVFCMAGTAVFMFAFWSLPATAPVWLIMLCLCAAGFFIYGPQALIGIAAANQATKKAAATANGFTGLFGYASVIVSGVGMGYVADKFGWDIAYSAMIAIAVVGLFVFLLMWNAKADGYER